MQIDLDKYVYREQAMTVCKALETLIKICSYSVPWELDDRDVKAIKKNATLTAREVINILWGLAQKG